MPTVTASPTSSFTALHAQLSQAILACRAHPAPKAVHTLRTTTRRIEGLLKKALEDHPGSKGFPKAADKSLRQVKKVRQLTGAVRDLDVHQKLLNKLIHETASSTAGQDTLHPNQHQLHGYLEQKRDQAADVLVSGLARREIRLERALESSALALKKLPDTSADPLTTARGWVERSAISPHELNAENLHDFRKRTKLARYVSEMQPPSPRARTFTRNLLATQDAIGAWHDLHLLHQEAKAVCGKHAALTELLSTRTEEALKKALAQAGSVHRPHTVTNRLPT